MIRKVTFEDVDAITDIYNYYIRNSVANLEETEASSEYIKNQVESVIADFPWYVYEENNNVVGFAYASKWKERSGYRKSVQLTVYLNAEIASKGIGTLLYKKIIDDLQLMDMHTLMAGISLPNEASVRLHEKFGFKKVAHYKEIGYKFNKWVDVGYWQLTLNK